MWDSNPGLLGPRGASLREASSNPGSLRSSLERLVREPTLCHSPKFWCPRCGAVCLAAELESATLCFVDRRSTN